MSYNIAPFGNFESSIIMEGLAYFLYYHINFLELWLIDPWDR